MASPMNSKIDNKSARRKRLRLHSTRADPRITRHKLLVLVVLGGGVFTACGPRKISIADVLEIQEKYEVDLMNQPGVVGLAVGLCPDPGGEPCLKILVEVVTPELDAWAPDQLEGVTVELEEIGPIESLPP